MESSTTTIKVNEHTRERKPKAKRDDMYAGLPIKEIKIPLTEEQRCYEYCNSEMTTIGSTQVSEEIRITPAKVERIRLMQEVAICPECKKDGDGYQGYYEVADVVLVCCLAHSRRKFYEAIPAGRRKNIKLLDINSETWLDDPVIPDEKEQENMIPAELGLSYCNKLFYIERELKKLPADERKTQREERETVVWNDFWKWIESMQILGGSKLEKAVNYAKNHRETLCNYMKDGRCEISNSAAERRAKSYAIGRKAFLFHTSVAGVNASAVMYSMVETTKSNNLNVSQ